MTHFNQEYVRSVVFGIEDSLVSTTGLIVGLVVGSNKEVVILAASVAIAIEALSMGAGEYLSDDAVHEIEKIKRSADNPIISGLLMMVSYFIAGMVPLIPIILFDYSIAIYITVVASLVGLFVLGFAKGKLAKVNPIKSSLKILIIGGLTAVIGIAVGLLLKV
jgi:VIT1/CCC1 family predicted Fe2+/Mn2+ transporter